MSKILMRVDPLALIGRFQKKMELIELLCHIALPAAPSSFKTGAIVQVEAPNGGSSGALLTLSSRTSPWFSWTASGPTTLLQKGVHSVRQHR